MTNTNILFLRFHKIYFVSSRALEVERTPTTEVKRKGEILEEQKNKTEQVSNHRRCTSERTRHLHKGVSHLNN
jgi:hypothetical protein